MKFYISWIFLFLIVSLNILGNSKIHFDLIWGWRLGKLSSGFPLPWHVHVYMYMGFPWNLFYEIKIVSKILWMSTFQPKLNDIFPISLTTDWEFTPCCKLTRNTSKPNLEMNPRMFLLCHCLKFVFMLLYFPWWRQTCIWFVYRFEVIRIIVLRGLS